MPIKTDENPKVRTVFGEKRGPWQKHSRFPVYFWGQQLWAKVWATTLGKSLSKLFGQYLLACTLPYVNCWATDLQAQAARNAQRKTRALKHQHRLACVVGRAAGETSKKIKIKLSLEKRSQNTFLGTSLGDPTNPQ